MTVNVENTLPKSFLQGDAWTYLAGIVAICIAAALVFFCLPKREEKVRLLAAHHEQVARG